MAASCAAAATFAQTETHAVEPGTHSKISHGDRSWIEKAAEAGREEVDIARIAAARATNPEVKQFAQMLVDDHTKANTELASLAAQRGVVLKDKDKSENRWAKKDAKDFDHDFVKRMISDHKKDIDLFTKESKDGEDPALVDFARKTLPTLQHHLEAVDTLEKTIRW